MPSQDEFHVTCLSVCLSIYSNVKLVNVHLKPVSRIMEVTVTQQNPTSRVSDRSPEITRTRRTHRRPQ